LSAFVLLGQGIYCVVEKQEKVKKWIHEKKKERKSLTFPKKFYFMFSAVVEPEL